MGPTLTDCDVVVVGAGLGGLTSGAYLARRGLRVLVLEETSGVGGRSSSRVIDGIRFPIGANVFGRRVLRILRDLDTEIPTTNAPMGFVIGAARLTFPARLTAFREARKLGLSAARVLRAAVMTALAADRPYPARCSTYQQVVEFRFTEPALREMLYLEAWMLGARPATLPACSFQVFLDRRYGYHRPFYPVDGADAIAQALAGVITGAGGAVMTACPVEAITVEHGDATGVLAQGTWIPARRAVISNADVRTTLGLLRGAPPSDGVAALLQRTRRYREGFSLACLLLLVTPDSPLLGWVTRRGYYQASTILMDSPVNDSLDALESGTLPAAPIVNLVSVEALIARKQHPPQPLPLVVLTLWPSASVSPSERTRFVDHVVDRLEGLSQGFRRSLLWQKLLDPAEYRAAFGISSCPAPVLDAPDYDKEAPALPVGRLFNVGTSVLPRGAHTGTAVESGRNCANLVLAAR